MVLPGHTPFSHDMEFTARLRIFNGAHSVIVCNAFRTYFGQLLSLIFLLLHFLSVIERISLRDFCKPNLGHFSTSILALLTYHLLFDQFLSFSS